MQFDVAIIGGGPAGAAAAISAANAGLATLVVDAAADAAFRIGETVPPDIEPLLRTLNVWDSFLRAGHLPVPGACSAFGTSELAYEDGFTHRHGGGWRLDRARFDAMLLDAAESAGATVLRGQRVQKPERKSDGAWRLTAKPAADGRNEPGWVQESTSSKTPTPLVSGGVARNEPGWVTAHFLIDAGGRGGGFARPFGAARMKADRLVAAYALLNVDPAAPPFFHTLTEAAEDGWWYAARLPDMHAVAGYFTDMDIARRLRASQPAAWHDLLTRTEHAFGAISHPACPNRVTITSASSYCLHRVYGDGWVAAGDAATAWDPLASAGIYLALQSGIFAADAAARRLSGDAAALPAYQRAIHERFTRFLFERRAYYALETRWPASTFWRRRASDAGKSAPLSE